MARSTTKRRAAAKRPARARPAGGRAARGPAGAERETTAATRDETRDALLDAALAIAAERGWRAVTLSAVAQRADVPLGRASQCFATRGAIVQAFIRRIDTDMLDAVGGGDAGEGSARDRLFDVIMSRFDAMAPYRAVITGLARALPADPALAVAFCPQAMVSAGWLMAAARLDDNTPLGLLRGVGVAAIALDTFRVWLNDDSEDMAKTMAALDRNLRRAERIARLLDRPRTPGPATV